MGTLLGAWDEQVLDHFDLVVCVVCLIQHHMALHRDLYDSDSLKSILSALIKFQV